MDDTQQSRASDAGATRKRRSSILKSQRPPRTPFSELEFNVATPTDTGKSRRVSFSRRTGVAEFVTNEATTTWKNFYEEHNKSLESSGNDSAANASRQPIGHLGKRIFEQQFEEVEAVDFITSLDNLAGRNINTTVNVNFTEQLASLECTDSNKPPPAPHNNFELSAFTDHHSNLFGDDLAIPSVGEMSGRIDVNFSAVQSIDVKDDLDEIQRDIQRQSNVVGPAPFRGSRNFSEYIEVELNSTQAAIGNEESDMSITETIASPKVNVSKNISSPDKKSSLNWVNDKENKCLDELDLKTKSLIFDTNMSITAAVTSNVGQKPEKMRATENTAEKRRTILFEDDFGDLSITKPVPAKLLSIHSEIINTSKNDMSCLQTHESTTEKRKTLLFEDDLGDLSMTKPIPTKLLSIQSEIIDKSFNHCSILQSRECTTAKRKTIIFDDDLGDLSITKPIATQFLPIHSGITDKSSNDKSILQTRERLAEKSKTIVFEDDLGDLSITKPIPAKLLSIHSEIINSSKNDMSCLKTRENHTEKRKTILFEDDLGDLSMTKPIPTKLLSIESEIKDEFVNNSSMLQGRECTTEKRKTILFDDNLGDLSMTKPIATQLLSIHSGIIDKSIPRTQEHSVVNSKTIVFEDDLGDLSMTKPTASHMVFVRSEMIDKSNLSGNFNKSNIELVNKTTENHFGNNFGDSSTTKPILTELLSIHSEIIDKSNFDNNIHKSSIHKENIFKVNKDQNTALNKNMKETSMILTEDNMGRKHKSVLFDDNGDLSLTKPISANLLTVHSNLIDKSNLNLSAISPVTAELITDHSENNKPLHELLDKNRSIKLTENTKFGNDISLTKPIPMNISELQSGESKLMTKATGLVSLEFSNFKTDDVVIYQATTNDASKVQNAEEDRETTGLLDKVEQGDIVTAESSKIENEDSKMKEDMSTVNENPLLEEIKDQEDSHKTFDKSVNIVEAKDMSRNVSIDSVVRNVSTMHIISKKSILCDLLDMSNASMASGLEDKDVTANISSSKHSTPEIVKTDTESVTSEMFYITRDTDSETQSNDIKERNAKISEDTNQIPLAEVSFRESIPEINSIQKTLSEIANSDKELIDADNKYSEKMVSTDVTDLSIVRDRNSMDISRFPKSIKDVDNTKELLDMLSDLTDGRQSISSEDPIEPITIKGHIALEDKETNEPRRVSIAPNRQSIVLSREDLLNNISMAQAALQRSIDMEDSDLEEPTPAVAITPPKKSVRVSNEVVKTLHFDDESSSEVSVKSDLRSPLKKTAFGETSYMKEGYKANVIPSYLKDVSDGIKSLMHDLVKPMADEQPFETVSFGKNLKKSPSTCSTQIQANLYTSSQIDVSNELYSNPESVYDMDREHTQNRMSPSAKNPLKSVSFIESDVGMHSDMVSKNLKEASFRPRRQSLDQSFAGKVLVFDHENPLNNVLLTPTEYTEVHRYCPIGESDETLSNSDKSQSTQYSVRGKEYDVENVSVRYNIGNYHSGDTGAEKLSTRQSMMSNLSKPISIDQSIGVKVTEVKDIEVNTAIAMKKNKELLEASSSLTLVDDALAHTAFDVDIDSVATESKSNISDDRIQAPLKVIYKLKGDVKTEETADSDFTSNDEAETAKAKKRIHSPSSSTPSKQNVTPKPISKMQRLSDSPHSKNYSLKRISGNKSLIPEKDVSSAESKMDVDISPTKESPRKRSPRKKNSPKKESMSITVQQLLTEFKVTPKINQEVLNKQILEALSRTDSSAAADSSDCEQSLELVSSFTSSKNQCAARASATAALRELEESRADEWRARDSDGDCAGVNVVAKIDMLPFMGSHECEWASSGTDTWCFRLLHGRLRLSVRLAHRHHNAARTRVRGDTPVLAVAVHQSHHGNDKKNSVAMFCISLAAEAIRSGAEGLCSRAGDVPALLRRGAAVARRALRWGRAMHDARVHLAYTLSDDGQLVLKVANIPLRCVWEVSMRVSLARPAGEMPWPRAEAVAAARVLDSAAPPPRLEPILAAVPPGWGHVPHTIWKVFKYLKNMTAEDDALGL